MTKLIILTSLFVCLLTFKSVKSATFTATSSGTWQTGGIWNVGSSPNCGSTIVIPVGFTVTINNNQFYTGGCVTAMTIEVRGTINFDGGKLRLPANSQVLIYPGAQLIETGPGGGSSSSIEIGGTEYWKASDGNVSGAKSFPPGLLPIELTYFKAKSVDSKSVQLNWQTTTEINNQFFSVERSQDGLSFETIKNIAGAGNNTSIKNYEFMDENASTGANYYRLKQTDFDGKFSYSTIAYVENNGKNLSLNVYPNPSKGDVKINISGDISGITNGLILKVSDITGKTIIENKFESGNQLMGYNLLLPTGYYFVSLESSNFKELKPLIVY